MKKMKSHLADMPKMPKEAYPHPMPMKSEEDKMRDGEHDLDHLLRAEDIKSDEDRMGYVKKAHEKRMAGMRSIADLKMAGQALADKKKRELHGEPDADEAGGPSDMDADNKAPKKPRVKARYPKGA